MSGHTFKVGDRVVTGSRCWEGRGTVKALVPDEPFVVVRFDDEMWEVWNVEYLSPLPLFAPVERWMQLTADGGLSLFTRINPPVLPHVDERWVKVVISPAEDQS